VPLLVRAYALWGELEARSGLRLFTRVGCLNLGPAGHPAIQGVLESVRRHGLPHRRLTDVEVRDSFSVLPVPGDLGVFEEDAGYLAVEACTKAHLAWATTCGAEVRQARVTALDVTGSSVRVTLDDGSSLAAERAVVAAGPWLASAPALQDLARDLPLVVERQVQLWFEPADPGAARAPALPAFIHFVEGGPFYGVPLDDAHASPAVKVCRHHGGARTTADALDRTVTPDDEATVRRYLRAHLPAADGPLLRSRVCMYTNTPDEHFVVGPLARAPRVVVLGGFSGHGYKMASVMGEIAADLVQQGKSAFDLGMFAPGRFVT
jgi:sarcosine oxidase